MDFPDVIFVDVIFLLITAAFFSAAVWFVRLCDRIIGADSADVTERTVSDGTDRGLVGVSPAAQDEVRS